ncbi:MAG: hypothetical protein M3R47_04045 [Chloroflexota bacterium]|nr:hypothetical protein [Chloroflexota bacterium]
MKLKSKTVPLSAKSQSKNKDDRHPEARRRIWMQLAAVFLIIVFLAGECSILLPME